MSEKFDFKKLAIKQDAPIVGKKVVNVPIKKPGKQSFVRVSPKDEHQYRAFIIEDETDREFYLVDPCITDAIQIDCRPTILFLSISRQEEIFFWPWKEPLSDGKTNSWTKSALEAIILAKTSWIRMVSDQSVGAYRVYQAEGKIADPIWPSENMDTLLDRAFKGKIITSVDHPVVKKLRGLSV